MKVKIAVSQEYHRLSQTDDAYNESYRLLELMKLGDSGAVVHCSDGNCRLVKKKCHNGGRSRIILWNSILFPV